MIIVSFIAVIPSNSNEVKYQSQNSACWVDPAIYCNGATWNGCGPGPGCNYMGPSGRMWCNSQGMGTCFIHFGSVWDRNCGQHFCAGYSCQVDISLPCGCMTFMCNC